MGKKIHARREAEEKAAVKEKRRLSEPKFFKICPKCGSLKVGLSKTKAHPDLPAQYSCKACHYTSYFFPAATKERLRRRQKNKKYP